MNNPVVKRMISILTERFRENFEEFNLVEDLNMQDPVTRRYLTDAEKEYVKKTVLTLIQYKESHDGASINPVSSVTDPKIHEEWYDEWLKQNNNPDNSYYWLRLEDFLARELTYKYGHRKAGIIVRSIDEATRVIMRNMANPMRKEFSYKGLVVGHVQSGKTANFTALIAKAADAGYKLIVVLAGIHNALRRQTQVRLDKELTGNKEVENDENYIDPPGTAHQWNRLSTATNEFSTNNLNTFSVLARQEIPSLAVVKKNTTVLKKLIGYLKKSTPEERARVPLLVIDDEADQASIDTNANNPDADLSKTNDCIRQLLGLFSRKTYVGYTATPFANVLIDMNSQHDTHEDDLYPRNFIVALPEPEGYFGASMVFESDLAEKFVKCIPDERELLTVEGEMTHYLSEAIDLFILACAVRNLRDEETKPMSMLVHVSHAISDMETIYELIAEYTENIKGRYNNQSHNTILKAQFKKQWGPFSKDADVINNGLNIVRQMPDFDEVWEEVGEVLSVLSVVKLNTRSEDRLNYTTHKEVKVIAIGGNQLSRGLTLEGLIISYYLRDSDQYDTLLQMGRWFGYRQGYEDLTRIFTTGNLWESFEHLALVEREMRSEIYRYEDEKLTPMDMAVAIKAHKTLKVTSPNKMGAARFRKTTFSESINQTIWLPLDNSSMLKANYLTGAAFIQHISDNIGFRKIDKTGVFLAKEKIDGQFVMKNFLSKYKFVDKDGMYGAGLDYKGLLEYINRRMSDYNPELTQWSIAVPGNLKPKYDGDPVLYGGLKINRPGRSRKYTTKGYNIGVLTESDHLKIDLDPFAKDPHDGRSPQNPLLLLYLIAKDSKAGTPAGGNHYADQRIDLFADVPSEKKDVLGIAIVLPKTESTTERNNYIGQ